LNKLAEKTPGGRSREEQKEFFLQEVEKYQSKYSFDSESFVSLYDHIWFTCKIHNKTFRQTPECHLNGEGCDICAKESRRLGKEVIIHRIREKCGEDCFDLSKIPDSVLTTDIITLVCNECGFEFPRRLTDLIYSQQCGCSKCAIENTKLGKEKFIERANQKRTEMGLSLYNYEKVVYVNNRTKVHIICTDCGKTFSQQPDNHLQGCGCPFCWTSKGEARVEKYLRDLNVEYVPQLLFGERQHFDFYLPEHDAYIEFDGKQHEESVEFFGGAEAFEKNCERDARKNMFCYGKKPLLRIKWYDYDNIEEILTQFMTDLTKWKKLIRAAHKVLITSIPKKGLEDLDSLVEYCKKITKRNITVLKCIDLWFTLYIKLTMSEDMQKI
jgi:protein-arginine kinase activator protein McsA